MKTRSLERTPPKKNWICAPANNGESELVRQALQGKIDKESYNEVRMRVTVNCSSSTIDYTIATMHDHLRIIAKNGGLLNHVLTLHYLLVRIEVTTHPFLESSLQT